MWRSLGARLWLNLRTRWLCWRDGDVVTCPWCEEWYRARRARQHALGCRGLLAHVQSQGSTTVPGGRYRRADGMLVNAHGEPLHTSTPIEVGPGRVTYVGPIEQGGNTANGGNRVRRW